MNAQSPNSKFTYQLPSMSYIDIKWEEPELRSPAAPRRAATHRKASGFAGLIAAFHAWQERRQAAADLGGMSERELKDIGLSRGDVWRAVSGDINQGLRPRG